MNKCMNCEQPARKLYCSVACQQKYAQAQKVSKWLETGEGVYHTSKKHWMRVYVLEDQGGTCSICKCPQEHNGRPLVFILDHISGDAMDHRRENLRMVCPNCDSQLDTYKGRNIGRGKRPKR